MRPFFLGRPEPSVKNLFFARGPASIHPASQGGKDYCMVSAYRIDLQYGDVLFREGDAPTTAFLIESGTLRITADRDGTPLLLSDLGAGALVGEMAVLDDSPRSATATAVAPCVLTPIDR